MDAEVTVAAGKLISAAEVARLAGVTRAAVSNWRRRHADFPQPVGGGRNALFTLDEICAWLERQRKSGDVAGEVHLWQALRGLYGDDMIRGLADVAELLAQGSAGALDGSTQSLVRDLAAATTPAETVEGLVERFINSTGHGTTARLVRAVRRAAGKAGGTIFDPACGTGTLLFAFHSGAGLTLTGQEVNRAAVRLARARAALVGEPEPKVRLGDSLRDDGWPGLGADLVVCDPPVKVADWGREELLLDPRWEFGVPTRAESELAWLQHCYAHTAPSGRVIFVMPPSVAYRAPGRRIRAELVRRGVLRQVIALPSGMVAGHSQPVHLWLLSRPTTVGRVASSVRMIDLGTADPDDPFAEESGRAVDVPLIDLLDDEVDLTPGRYVAAARADHLAEYAAARKAILAKLAEALHILPPLDGPRDLSGGMLRIGDLARAGLVDIVDGGTVSASARLDTDFLHGFLRSSANTARATSGSGSFRADVRGSRVPQMSIEDQRRYGAAFRAVDDFERRLKELAALAEETVALARDGLTSGALRPEDPNDAADSRSGES